MIVTGQLLKGAIESTLLSPVALAPEVEKLCREAAVHGFHGVCVSPCRVGLARRALAGTTVRVVSVAGFPLGFETVRAKVCEVADLLDSGAEEVDVVINQALVLEGEWYGVEEEIRQLRAAAGPAILKIILETGRLDPASLHRAAEICIGSGVDYLKTSTGLGPRGASVEDVHFLCKIAAGRAGVKAAGGIRTLEDAVNMLKAGAARLGTSNAGSIWNEFSQNAKDG